jgi:Uma2 family endonuclease
MKVPLPQAAKRAASHEDLLDVPEHLVGEIVDGELYTSPRPASPHARAASRLGARLDPFDSGSSGPGGWIILYEPELHLGGNVLVPDLAGWRRERMPEMPDVAAFELAPDWICEILSPSTEGLDRSLKMPQYRKASVAFAWLIDPGARSLEIYRLQDRDWHLDNRFQGETPVRAAPFDAVPLDLAALWAR